MMVRGRSLLAQLTRVPLLIALAFFVVGAIVAGAVLAPWISPHDPMSQSLLQRLHPPLFAGGELDAHILGTDQLGRDITSRVLLAMRTSLAISAIGMFVGLTIGTLLGITSGLFGGHTDNAIMFLVDVQLAIPFTLLALTAIAILGTSPVVLVSVIGLAGWDSYARLVRGQVLSLREVAFVEAAHAIGASRWRIARRHILPNLASPLIVLATFNFTAIVLLESALSYLGLGVQPPNVSLGSMISSGRDHLVGAWWISIVPGAVLVSITLLVSLIGDWLRDVLDPRLRT